MSHVAVFGPGLMGASLLMALRKKSPESKLTAWARREEAVRELQERGLVDIASTDPATVVRGAEAVVLCVPVDRMEEVAGAISPFVDAEALVTDVGSTKEGLCGRLEKIFSKHANFVGSHPMCGSESSGLQAARADLYEGALCVVCPTSSTRSDLPEKAQKLWQSLGARTAIMSPVEHDAAAAVASHVPHVAAAALVGLVASEHEAFRSLCSSGFRDTTRIASGSPEIWSAILSENSTAVCAALEKLEGILAKYRRAISLADNGGVRRMLGEAAAARAKLVAEN